MIVLVLITKKKKKNMTISKSTKAGIAKVTEGVTIALACAFIGFTGLSAGNRLIIEGAKNLGWGKHSK